MHTASLKWSRENVFEQPTKIFTTKSGFEYSVPSWIQLHSEAFIRCRTPARIFSPCIWHILVFSATYHTFIFSSQSLFFWFSRGRSEEASVLRNLISWVNAKRWLCSIRSSTLFGPISYSPVSKKSRQHKHDKLRLSCFLTERWNCVIVTAVKIPQVKNTTEG